MTSARVAIDVIRTGGTVGAPPATGLRSFALPTSGMVFAQTFSVKDAQYVAELTGGRAAAFVSGEAALRALDEGTRFQYQLGYDPSNPAADGKFRSITIKVNRPGARVTYRRGYFAREQLVPLDRRAFLTFTRISAAGQATVPLTDLGVTLGKPALKIAADRQYLEVPITVRSPRIAFDIVDGKHVADLDVAVFCGDGARRIVGEAWQKMEFKLSDEGYQRFQAEGATYTARVPVTDTPLHVKVIVYDYKSDLVGAATAGPRDPGAGYWR